MFFSFDGLDGVGKTTQIELFIEWLRAAGRDVVRCQDPARPVSLRFCWPQRANFAGERNAVVHGRPVQLLPT
jgi:hypothetical protein